MMSKIATHEERSPTGATPRRTGISVGERLPDLRSLLPDGSEFVLSEDAGGLPIALVTGSVRPRRCDDVLVIHVAPPSVALASTTDAALTLVDDGRITAALTPGTSGVVVAGHDHRVVAVGGADEFDRLVTLLPRCDEPVRRTSSAPFLTVPDIVDDQLRRNLIDAGDRAGWVDSPMIRPDGYGAGELRTDDTKSRRDHLLVDSALTAELDRNFQRRLLPEIMRGLAHRITRHERYKIVRYDADSGWFQPHRDNTAATATHRMLAVTVNLDRRPDHDGGDLRFPEIGADVWRPEPGAAFVFSCGLLHEVVPVTRGCRHALVTFLS